MIALLQGLPQLRPAGGSALTFTRTKHKFSPTEAIHTNTITHTLSQTHKQEEVYLKRRGKHWNMINTILHVVVCFLHKETGSSVIHYQLVRAGVTSTYSRFCGRILLVCVASFFFKTVRLISINGAEEVGARGFAVRHPSAIRSDADRGSPLPQNREMFSWCSCASQQYQ